LEEKAKQLNEAQDRNAELLSDQADFDWLVIDTDKYALNKYLSSHAW
jgi:hypothetical protein